MNGRRLAFLAFLDLISCAFGSAVLIFVVAASAGRPEQGVETSHLMLVRVSHLGGTSPEIELECIDPDGMRRLSSEFLPPGWRRFAAPAGSGGGTYLVIPQPQSGSWTFRAFWTDADWGAGVPGSPEPSKEARFSMEIFCPRGTPQDRAEFEGLTFGPRNRFSHAYSFRVGR